MLLTAPVSVSTLVDELLWNTVKLHVESSLHFQCYSKYSRHFHSFHVINTMKFASFVSVYMVAFPYCKWCSQVWLRWRSIRTCAHLLLQELQNYNSLQNKHWQENVDSHKKKIPYVQGQRRSPSKTYPSKVQFSHSVVSDSLWPHESRHARTPCPSLSPKDCSNSCPLSRWCHPAISSSVVPFFSCPQSLPASGSFQWVNSSHEVAKVLEFQL